MFKDQRISLVIPCLNEEAGLQRVLPEIPKIVDEVLIVDNGSTDRSVEIAKKFGVKVIQENQRGYGRAYKTGFTSVSGDIIATADGDGTYPIFEIPRLIEYLVTQKLDFISAYRFPLQQKEAMSLRNWFGNQIFNLAVWLTFGLRLKDALSGMWVFRRELLEKMTLLSDGWAFSEEIKIEAFRKAGKGKAVELHIPFQIRSGSEKLPAFKAALEGLSFLLKKRFYDLF